MPFCSPRDLLRWTALLLGLCLAPWAAFAMGVATPVLRLADAPRDYDLWPMVTVLVEGDRRLSASEALARSAEFAVPDGPHANLGVRSQPVWLRAAVEVDPGSDGAWLLDIDYPALDEALVAVTRQGAVETQIVLGRNLLLGQRPIPARSHAVALWLRPGASYAILVRVATSSSMIVPLRLIKQVHLSVREARVQLIQGLAAGIGLCLMLYALAHGFNLRDPAFFYYALSVGSITLFFFTFEGLSAQHLWSGSLWLTRNAAPLLVMPALTGGLLFLERTLNVRQLLPGLGRAMLATAAVTVAVALCFVLGALDYRQAHLAGTVLGLSPILLGLPAAWLRVRGGDRAALYILVGWGVYAIGILIMAALLRGAIEFNRWTQHAFQVGALTEMVMWVFVLGVRASELRHQAERAAKERQALHAMAHTDVLTGLLNRRGLQLRLQEEISRARQQRLTAVYLLDLDGFKAVNDRLGHDAGDELLRAVARRLRASLRATDVVARMGGDEFVILALCLPGELEAHQLGQKVLRAFKQPFQIHSSTCNIGLTIGYAVAPGDGVEAAQLLKLADAAMYAGKQAGKNRVQRGVPMALTCAARM